MLDRDDKRGDPIHERKPADMLAVMELLELYITSEIAVGLG